MNLISMHQQCIYILRRQPIKNLYIIKIVTSQTSHDFFFVDSVKINKLYCVDVYTN